MLRDHDWQVADCSEALDGLALLEDESETVELWHVVIHHQCLDVFERLQTKV